jgi:P27 family predicted phage terminase small subunit
MRGRKPKPAALRAITGRGGDLPSLSASRPPDAPGWLSDRAAGFWAPLVVALSVRRVLTPADGLALGMVAEALADWRAARDAIEAAGGETYEAATEAGAVMLRPHPAVAQRNDAWRRVMAGLAEFGLSPASRERVSPGDAGPVDPLAEEYFR